MYDIVKFLYSIICLNTSHPRKIITHFSSEKEKFVADNDVKQLFTVYNLEQKYLGVLRPEMTYLGLQDCNRFKDAFFYTGACFRNERKQFLRFKEFTQLGIERITNNIYVHLYNFLIVMIIQKIILQELFVATNILIHLIYADESIFSKMAQKIFAAYDIRHNQNIRLGDVNQYHTLAFEAEHIAPRNIEILGGGIYNHMDSYGVGLAMGLERLIHFVQPQQKQIIKTFIAKQLTNQQPATIYINYRPADYQDEQYLMALVKDIEALINAGNTIDFNITKDNNKASGYKVYKPTMK